MVRLVSKGVEELKKKGRVNNRRTLISNFHRIHKSGSVAWVPRTEKPIRSSERSREKAVKILVRFGPGGLGLKNFTNSRNSKKVKNRTKYAGPNQGEGKGDGRIVC